MKQEYMNDRVYLEQRLTTLETKLNEVMNNHIPHLEEKMDKIQWLLIATLIGVVANLIEKLV